MKLKVYPTSEYVLAYASAGASGLDLRAAIGCERTIEVGQRWKFPTGVHLAIPIGFEGQVRGRSGLALNHAVDAVAGTIDSDYRGEVMVMLINNGRRPYVVLPGERIAQLVLCPVAHAEIEIVGELNQLGHTERGESGFGSTGR